MFFAVGSFPHSGDCDFICVKKRMDTYTGRSNSDATKLLAIDDTSYAAADRLVAAFFVHYITLKMFHFQTKWYSRHKAVDSYLTEFLEVFDRFFEAIQGVLGQRLQTERFDLRFGLVTDDTIESYLANFRKLLVDLPVQSTDLLNLRDELLGYLDQLQYLLTFQ